MPLDKQFKTKIYSAHGNNNCYIKLMGMLPYTKYMYTKHHE